MAGHAIMESCGYACPPCIHESFVDWSPLTLFCNWKIHQGWVYVRGRMVTILGGHEIESMVTVWFDDGGYFSGGQQHCHYSLIAYLIDRSWQRFIGWYRLSFQQLEDQGKSRENICQSSLAPGEHYLLPEALDILLPFTVCETVLICTLEGVPLQFIVTIIA